jgi:hypothetical protein
MLLGCASTPPPNVKTPSPGSRVWVTVDISSGAASADVDTLRAHVLALPDVEGVDFLAGRALGAAEGPTFPGMLLIKLSDPRQAKGVVDLILRDPSLAAVVDDPADPSSSVRDLSAGWAIQVFLKDSAKAGDVAALRDAVALMPNVIQVTYVSKETALERFKEQTKNSPALVEQLRGNPLPASFEVTLDDPRQTQAVVDLILKDPHLRKVVNNPSDPLANDIRYPAPLF